MEGRVCLVTGAAGFIGSHLVRQLSAQGARVNVLVRPGASLDRIADCRSKIRVHQVDLRDTPAVREAAVASRPDLVFHLATPSRGGNTADVATARQSIDDIVTPLVDLVDALASLPTPPRAFLRAGTIAEYGLSPLPYRERQREKPITPYGAAMLAGTHYLDMLQPHLPFRAVTARLALTYGIDQSDQFLVPQLVDACLEGRSIQIQRPDDRRDLIHVDDVVSAFLALAQTRNMKSGIINVSTGTAPSMREVAAEVISATKCDPSLVEQRRQSGETPINELRSDASLARETYAWSPRIGLRQGLSQLISARRAQLGLGRAPVTVNANG